MAAAAPGLYDSFTERGQFWLANSADDKVPGLLSFDPEDGAVLSLSGVFGKLGHALDRAFGLGGRDERHVIHGLTMKGTPVSILEAHDAKREIHIPRMAHETWESNLLIIGAHLMSSADEAIFPKSYFRFEAIEAWLEHDPFTRTVDTDERSLTILAETPKNLPFASHADFEVSSVGSLNSSNEPSTRFTIDVTSQMAIEPAAPKSLDWHLDRAARLQELASLCTGDFFR